MTTLAGPVGLADRDRRAARLPPGVPAARRGRRRPPGAPRDAARDRARDLRARARRRAGHADELTPGFTEYAERTQVQTLRRHRRCSAPGRHELDALLADGWYRGQVGILRATRPVGDRDGVPRAAASSSTRTAPRPWSAPTRPGGGRTTHIVAADLIEGQREDRRLRRRARLAAGRRSATAGTTRWSPRPRRRCGPCEELRPVAVTELRPGVHVVDLGQNINGRVRLTEPRAGGHRDHADPRRGARPGRRRDDDAPAAGDAVPARAAQRRPGRQRRLGRGRGRRRSSRGSPRTASATSASRATPDR